MKPREALRKVRRLCPDTRLMPTYCDGGWSLVGRGFGGHPMNHARPTAATKARAIILAGLLAHHGLRGGEGLWPAGRGRVAPLRVDRQRLAQHVRGIDRRAA